VIQKKMAKLRSKIKRAHASLEISEKQLHKASVHSWEPSDPAQCVTMTFYSYENAVVAAAIALGYEWQATHPSKVDVARRLVKEGRVKTDIGERLTELNRLRKDVSYGDAGEELSGVDLEDVVAELEAFIGEVDELLSSLGRRGRKSE
jgi:uncharacterized protein (UPF0332 family)